ncbi:hypothetical protein [Bifidobacterium tsurumiense]|uniref:hypothetical protein n=1 Tax=Bifidobacterium tsurumiense TaxID=356829 RepID=UPI001EE6404E|nr:hypothetical protein [Bifidobacterium tsurumiense]
MEYTGSWSQVDDATASEGTITRSSTLGDSATFSFVGTGMRLLVGTGVDHGKFSVSIDDGDPVEITKATVDTEQNKPAQLEVFSVSDLSEGVHKIVITNLGGDTGDVISLDAFEVTSSTSPKVVNNDDASITFSPNWDYASGKKWTSGDINGDEHFFQD